MKQLRLECAAVLSVWLVASTGEELSPWQPGAHIDVTVRDGTVRQYSLCGDPADLSSYRIAVLLESASRGGSAFIHERLRPGDLVPVSKPRNNFELVDSPRYLFIAGGIGITPLLPMVERVDRAGADWRLVYGGKRLDAMAFVAELRCYGERVHLVPQDVHGLLDLDALLGTAQPATAVYCCGPEPLIEAVEQRCQSWPDGALHVERFTPRPREPEASPVGAPASFTVICQRSGKTVPVGPAQTILEALEAAGISVDFSCRDGICGTCETKILAGRADHRDDVLSERERAENRTMMVCISRALTDPLVLDV